MIDWTSEFLNVSWRLSDDIVVAAAAAIAADTVKKRRRKHPSVCSCLWFLELGKPQKPFLYVTYK